MAAAGQIRQADVKGCQAVIAQARSFERLVPIKLPEAPKKRNKEKKRHAWKRHSNWRGNHTHRAASGVTNAAFWIKHNGNQHEGHCNAGSYQKACERHT